MPKLQVNLIGNLGFVPLATLIQSPYKWKRHWRPLLLHSQLYRAVCHAEHFGNSALWESPAAFSLESPRAEFHSLSWAFCCSRFSSCLLKEEGWRDHLWCGSEHLGTCVSRARCVKQGQGAVWWFRDSSGWEFRVKVEHGPRLRHELEHGCVGTVTTSHVCGSLFASHTSLDHLVNSRVGFSKNPGKHSKPPSSM